MGSYTTKELERDTGFGRRTIAYYVQEGLLPRVGRRGPRTRYPELVRDRLLFIRRAREAEAESEIRPVSLSNLRELFEELPRGLVASVAAGDTPITPDILSLPTVDPRSMVDRVSALRERLLSPQLEPAVASPVALRSLGSPFEDEVAADAMSPPEPDEDADTLGKQLSWVLNELQAQARRRREGAPDAVDTWSQVEITSDLRLSIRGMAEEDAFLLRVAGRLLRQVLERRSSLAEGSFSESEE